MKELHISMEHMPTWDQPIHACIGYFDGIHRGHQQLIRTVVDYARKQGGTAALITFEPDPWQIIKGMTHIPHLMSMKQRQEAAAALGVELWIILDFTEEMAQLPVVQFHERILYPLPLRNLVCGFDFHYAYRGKGDVHTLCDQTRFPVTIIDEVSSDFVKISSTGIETLIQTGDMEKAEALLGRPYQMEGNIVHGLANGRKMGFPTANLQPDTHYVCPKEGVYAGGVQVEECMYPAMINVGKNPTIGEFADNRIEAHILGFERDIYGMHVTFAFYRYLRTDQKFNNLDELQTQLTRDRADTLTYLEGRGMDAPSSI